MITEDQETDACLLSNNPGGESNDKLTRVQPYSTIVHCIVCAKVSQKTKGWIQRASHKTTLWQPINHSRASY